MRLLVTGGAGFIGSNLILWLHRRVPDLQILNLDKLTYASDLGFLAPIEESERYRFVRIDLADRDAVREVVREWEPDGVIHLAAESHVDNSIRGPEPFVYSNVVGTFNLLEECRQFWNESSGRSGNGSLSQGPDLRFRRFLHVSTDEVYGTLGDEGLFHEETPYAPNSPYSATKAGSDMLVRSYFHTFGMNVVITHCSNNFGPHQHDEKLIPTVIRHALSHEPIPVYGEGSNVRDWLYVEDHCEAIWKVFESGRTGESYNIGGDNEWRNLNLVREICRILDEEVGQGPEGGYESLITFVTDRPGHDYRYGVDSTRIRQELGWAPSGGFEERLRKTILWYVERHNKSTQKK